MPGDTSSSRLTARYDRLIAVLGESTLQRSCAAYPRAEDTSTVAAGATTEEHRQQLLTEATAKSVRCAELIAQSLQATGALSKLGRTLTDATKANDDEDENMESEDDEDEQTTLLLQDLVAAGDDVEDATKKYAKLGVVRKSARASQELLAAAGRNLTEHLADETDAAVQNEFRDLYMEEFTAAFGDELDHFRQEERFESKDVAYLISCIHAGGDIFSPLQKKLFVESVAASRTDD